ncbi:LysR family transcriptional regulator [Roseomonas sp. OT10]|uniref:LysR family transcriptional regulator n=1 Tax=Roseomonas cutis TaxID=2897332 RepID=UPI001E626FF6|nr:LysR family transcriptional regulator [Roseomonas sp. OT10]UFN49036.1 LysR family transcriptional regulator [Roseomonas sp. OT10]
MLDPLTLDQLRVLIAVAETGSFSAAARRLQRVQSAISQSVQSLEGTLRLTLFDRSGKRPRLTGPGQAVLADARRMVEGARMLRARAESISQGMEPELTVAVDQLFPRQPGMAALRALQAQFPDLAVRLLTEGVGAPERHLRNGIAQFAIYPVEITGATELESEFLVEVEMLPVAAAGHRLAAHDRMLTREDLLPEVQLVLTDVSDTRGWSRGIVSQHVWRFADMHTRLDFLLEGFGWCNMPAHVVEPHLASGALRPLRIQGRGRFVLALHVVYRAGRPPGIAGRWMIDRLRAELGTA